MLQVLTFALLDSVNLLLIAVVVGIGVALPSKYGRVAALLVGGDWLGVFVASVLCLVFFDSIGSAVTSLVHSPVFGWILIITGLIALVMSIRGGDSSAMVERIMAPLRAPSIGTVGMGFMLGAVQSLTSAPFYGGLLVLSASGLNVLVRYLTLFLYATLALSLPTLCAICVGYIRSRPESWLGRSFVWARDNKEAVNKFAGFFVAFILIVVGVFHL
ncbi:hypothetical protein [Corynebacterium sp.]|uniref:hypothetical protein n=1 Tax=Corynebacterium sp. TaxID=1720 RepID=UPI0026DC3225|nr:hypothetical protein [Corynebacterium sp.]MDO5077302.1 hypothetical protein [Corynebacterium sp.]